MKLVSIAIFSLLITACGSPSKSAQSPAQPPVTSPTSETSRAEQRVTIDSADGLRIVGSYYAAAKPNSPALLLLHQWQSDRHSYDEFAKLMNSNGFEVLSVDGRGFGESTKKADGSLVTAGRTDADVKAMLRDVDAAIQFLRKQKNVDPYRVCIAGASYGSSLAIIYAAEHADIKAVALLSPGLNYFGNMPIAEAVEKTNEGHLLFLAAEDDRESADAVRKVKPKDPDSRHRTIIYPSGGHGTALLKVGASADLEDFFTEWCRIN